MKTIQIQFNRDFLEFKKGQKTCLVCDSEGTPVEQRFRNLLKDSQIDKTVSVVEPEKEVKPKSARK